MLAFRGEGVVVGNISFVLAYRGEEAAVGVLLFNGAGMKFWIWSLSSEVVDRIAILYILVVNLFLLYGRKKLSLNWYTHWQNVCSVGMFANLFC